MDLTPFGFNWEMNLLKINSSGFRDGFIMDKYGKRSENLKLGVPQTSFPLQWDGQPEGTQSFSIVFLDYDDIPDEGFCWIHWLACDIPKDVTSLAENASRDKANLIQGRNSWMTPLGEYGLDESITCYYGGPAPDRDHEYEVSIYALDKVLGLNKGFYLNELRKKMEGHILDTATLKGIYTG